LGSRREGKVAIKVIVGFRACGCTFLAMVNFAGNHIQVIVGNWQPH
jgi:hypothetical protein